MVKELKSGSSSRVTTKELSGSRVMGGKNGSKRIGKLRSFVFHPKEKRCIGIIVKRPDLLWMFRRKDRFVPLGGFSWEDGRIVIDPEAKTDSAACKELGVSYDDCVLWQGLPVMTESGELLGVVGTIEFSLVSGKVFSFVADTGATAKALLGTRVVDSSLILGFKRGVGQALNVREGKEEEPVLGALLVSDEAASLAVEGGAAEKAGAATAVAIDKAHTAADKAKVKVTEAKAKADKEIKPTVKKATKAAGDAVNKGAYATGKQLGKASGMFAAFKEEYDKARNGDD